MPHLALIVEDEFSLRVIYETVLQRMDFEVIHAADGAQAMELLSYYTPNLILLDVLLPKIDGEEVLNFIHEQPHLDHVPLVVVTAHSRFQEMLPLSAKDTFLLKPVRPRDLQLAAERILEMQ